MTYVQEAKTEKKKQWISIYVKKTFSYVTDVYWTEMIEWTAPGDFW